MHIFQAINRYSSTTSSIMDFRCGAQKCTKKWQKSDIFWPPIEKNRKKMQNFEKKFQFPNGDVGVNYFLYKKWQKSQKNALFCHFSRTHKMHKNAKKWHFGTPQKQRFWWFPRLSVKNPFLGVCKIGTPWTPLRTPLLGKVADLHVFWTPIFAKNRGGKKWQFFHNFVHPKIRKTRFLDKK